MNIGKETEYIEFKRSTAETKEAIESMSAILNKHGYGTLYFGVNDSGEIRGQQIGQDTLNKLSQDINNQLKPICIYDIERTITPDGLEFIQVTFNGDKTPYSANGKYFIRFHDEDRQMDNDLLRNYYLSKRKDYSEWEKQDSGEGIDAVDEIFLKLYIDKARELKRVNYEYTNAKDVLGKLGLLYEGKTLNNAGKVLFSCNFPIQVKMATFASESRLTILNMTLHVGNIFDCIDYAMEFYSKNINWNISFDGSVQRIEKPEIPLVAIREIIVNAFCHADYNSITDFEIDIFKDRVCIYSPGQFPKPYTPEMFAEEGLEPIPLNTTINNVLYRYGAIEQFSTGFIRTFDACKKESIKYDYTQTPFGFRFTFYRPNVNLSKSNLNSTDKKVLKSLTDNNKYTVKELANDLQLSERTINRVISKLKSINLLKRNGSDKYGNWIVM